MTQGQHQLNLTSHLQILQWLAAVNCRKALMRRSQIAEKLRRSRLIFDLEEPTIVTATWSRCNDETVLRLTPAFQSVRARP
jgi:hypothetical protein